jgi:hypothetical protein
MSISIIRPLRESYQVSRLGKEKLEQMGEGLVGGELLWPQRGCMSQPPGGLKLTSNEMPSGSAGTQWTCIAPSVVRWICA